jgi:hypothetical protein
VSIRPTPEQLAKIKAWTDSCCELMQPLEMICGQPPTSFDGDEQIIVCLPGVELMEARAVRYSRGAYGGSSIRIMKGLSIRSGGYAGRSQSVDELTVIDGGTLVLTTKRLAFLGAIRTNSVRLQDIISTQPFTDGFELHRERKPKAETYYFSRPLTILEGSGAGLPVVGYMITTAISLAKLDDEVGPAKVAEFRQEAARRQTECRQKYIQ